MTKKILISYLQNLAATALTAALAIGKSPLDFTNADFKMIVNAVWIAFIPVVIRALSKSDTAFGVGAHSHNSVVSSKKD